MNSADSRQNETRGKGEDVTDNLILLSREEALGAMRAGERLVNSKDGPDIASYKWDGGKVVVFDGCYWDSAKAVPENELPQLYRRGPDAVIRSIADEEGFLKNQGRKNIPLSKPPKIIPFPFPGPDFEDELIEFREGIEAALYKPGWTLIGYRYERRMKDVWGYYRQGRAPDVHLFEYAIDYENEALVLKRERAAPGLGFQDEAGFITPEPTGPVLLDPSGA
jgi:hypothetical protein